jgi:hypothetical protein
MLTEDLNVFFNTDELAQAATLGGAAVSGVLESGFDSGALAGFGPGAGSSPTYTLPSSSVPADPEGLLLVVPSGPAAGSYRVGNQFHDGTGVCTLSLLLQRTN